MMIKYPKVLNTVQETLASITLQLFIPEELEFFRGHFPGMPILAGVVQVDWEMLYARELLKIELEDAPMVKQIKFTNMIKPGATLFLNIKLEGQVIHFKYFDDESVYSLGQIKV